MNDSASHEQAVDLLQELGLKEYEARCFVALARLPQGTAKDISETSDVPRTRVYDAVRVLETKGLVEVQHANPQQFRAVEVDEAVTTLRREYETRTESLREALRTVEPASREETDVTHEVWTLSGRPSITTRAQGLIDAADREVLLILGSESVLTDALLDHLRTAAEQGVDLIVGAVSEDVRATVADELPAAEVFVSGLEWIRSSAPDDTTEIGRLLLVDRSAILVSSFHENGDATDERAVFGRGFDNGLVTIVRRLMATGLLPREDPGTDAA